MFLKLAYVLIYIGCLIGQHYGILPTGSEIVAVGLFAGEGIASALASRTPNSNQQNIASLPVVQATAEQG